MATLMAHDDEGWIPGLRHFNTNVGDPVCLCLRVGDPVCLCLHVALPLQGRPPSCPPTSASMETARPRPSHCYRQQGRTSRCLLPLWRGHCCYSSRTRPLPQVVMLSSYSSYNTGNNNNNRRLVTLPEHTSDHVIYPCGLSYYPKPYTRRPILPSVITLSRPGGLALCHKHCVLNNNNKRPLTPKSMPNVCLIRNNPTV